MGGGRNTPGLCMTSRGAYRGVGEYRRSRGRRLLLSRHPTCRNVSLGKVPYKPEENERDSPPPRQLLVLRAMVQAAASLV